MTHKVRLREWVRLESMESKDERSKVNDISVIFRVSPYDVPEAIRGSRDPNTDRFRIEFRYLSDEPTEEHRGRDGSLLYLGKHSGRLYGIELPAVPGGVARFEVRFEIERFRKVLADAKPASKRPRNLELAEQAISAHMSDFMEAVAV